MKSRLAYLRLFGNVTLEVNVSCSSYSRDEEIIKQAMKDVLQRMGPRVNKALMQRVENKENWALDFPKGMGYGD